MAQQLRFKNNPFYTSKGFLCYAERSELQELNLKDCRAYLRKHGLRITGTKAECTHRIMEHWRSVATSHIKFLAPLSPKLVPYRSVAKICYFPGG